MNRVEPVLRVATPDDSSRVEALMKESAAALFPLFYDEQQSASAVRYVAEADPMLLSDGTFFVLESDGELVACGGWSRRDRLYTGSGDSDGDSRTLDPATEPAKVRAMFVRADWTRRGLGRRIVEECEAAARREGYRRLAPGVRFSAARGERGRSVRRSDDDLRRDGKADRARALSGRRRIPETETADERVVVRSRTHVGRQLVQFLRLAAAEHDVVRLDRGV
jgi:GNAT superfamily N-acetyltransferase